MVGWCLILEFTQLSSKTLYPKYNYPSCQLTDFCHSTKFYNFNPVPRFIILGTPNKSKAYSLIAVGIFCFLEVMGTPMGTSQIFWPLLSAKATSSSSYMVSYLARRTSFSAVTTPYLPTLSDNALHTLQTDSENLLYIHAHVQHRPMALLLDIRPNLFRLAFVFPA